MEMVPVTCASAVHGIWDLCTAIVKFARMSCQAHVRASVCDLAASVLYLFPRCHL